MRDLGQTYLEGASAKIKSEKGAGDNLLSCTGTRFAELLVRTSQNCRFTNIRFSQCQSDLLKGQPYCRNIRVRDGTSQRTSAVLREPADVK